MMKSIGRIWSQLVAPHPSITDIEQRRQSRLLAGLMIVLGATSLLAAVATALEALSTHTTPTFYVIPPVILLGVFYFINRSGHYRLAAYLFIIQTFAVVHVLPFFVHDITWLFFASMVMIIGAILLPWRGTLILFVCSVLALIVGKIAAPGTVEMSNIGAMIVFFVTTSLLMTFIQHRTQLERERQAELRSTNEKLVQAEVYLENRVAERTRDLEVAAGVSRQITTTLDLNVLLQNVVDKTKNAFNLNRVSVYLYNAEANALALNTGSEDATPDTQAPTATSNLATEAGPVFEAARGQKSILVQDSADSQLHANGSKADSSTKRSELALPMMLGGRLIGILDLQSEQASRFSQDDVRILQSLAEQIAIAVENAALFKQQVSLVEQLRALDSMKSQFLASMSHELRTPLNAILNFTEFMKLGMLGPVNSKQEDALDKSLGSGQHLLSLINDVLDMTKIQSGMMRLFVESDVDLKQEIAAVVAGTEPLLKGKSVKFVQDIDANLPIIVGDRRRIRQILLNLLSNACKFTDEGTVTLSVKSLKDGVLFAVSDTGPGIAPEDIGIIFEPFRQTATGIQHAGGTGLGLPISQKLAEAHGGKLWVESAPGNGAVFYVTLPSHSDELLKMIELPEGA
ncbi:MAG TPA: GAF domain-containing sensor histidine kinase [Aggregatilineales bacterium]|nr:GAF domain-containing sensor histidine kinase [Aggregatilineales bacterium]